MGKYENGESTRQLILDTAAKLFYEKGFDETSMDEICALAHLRRSSVYYHFRSKDAILQQVLKSLTLANQKKAEAYCDVPEYWYALAFAIIWEQFLHDEKIRRMLLQWTYVDPLFASSDSYWDVHLLCYQPFSKRKLNPDEVREINAASAYALIVNALRLAAERYDTYTTEEMLCHCVTSLGRIYHLDDEVVNNTWTDILRYVQKIPLEQMREYPFA